MRRIAFFFLALSFLAVMVRPAAAYRGPVATTSIPFGDVNLDIEIHNPGLIDCPVVVLLETPLPPDEKPTGENAKVVKEFKGLAEAKQAAIKPRVVKYADSFVEQGIIAVVPKYEVLPKEKWIEAIKEVINFSSTIPNADGKKIGLIGYAVGGAIALRVASQGEGIKAVAVISSYLPETFSAEDAKRLPPLMTISGSEEPSFQMLKRLDQLFEDNGDSLYTLVNYGYGDQLPSDVEQQNVRDVIQFMNDHIYE